MAQYRLDRLTPQSNLSFSYLDGPDRLAGTFTTSYLIDGLVRLLYDYSDKTQLHAEFEQLTDIYPSQLDSFEYVGRLGADYEITPKIKLGLKALSVISKPRAEATVSTARHAFEPLIN